MPEIITHEYSNEEIYQYSSINLRLHYSLTLIYFTSVTLLNDEKICPIDMSYMF